MVVSCLGHKLDIFDGLEVGWHVMDALVEAKLEV
jgi:hypothetical protein